MDASNHTSRLSWKNNGYDKFRMYTHEVPGDGSCLVHSICYCTYIPYRTRRLNGEILTRKLVVKRFREQMADKLVQIDKATNKPYYDSLGLDGRSVKEYSLEHITTLLRSRSALTITELFVISKILRLNIFILESSTRDVYVTGMDRVYRKSIVLLHSHEHFSPVSVADENTSVHFTYFDTAHPFISHIRQRLAAKATR